MIGPIPLKALVSEHERQALALAAQRLELNLTQALKENVTFSRQFDASYEDLQNNDEPCIVVTSLLADVADDAPWAEVERRVRARYEALTSASQASIFVMTVFRHVGDLPAERASALRLRIRQLDRLAAELSRELGVMVIDIDRDLANLGARNLHTDYRLEGSSASAFAAQTVALAVVSMGLDAFVPFEAQEVAKALLANDNADLVISQTTDVKPSNILAFGAGRGRQTVQTIVDTNSENHAGWLVHLVLHGKLSPRDAVAKLRNSIARRGLLASAAMILSAVRQSANMRGDGRW